MTALANSFPACKDLIHLEYWLIAQMESLDWFIVKLFQERI